MIAKFLVTCFLLALSWVPEWVAHPHPHPDACPSAAWLRTHPEALSPALFGAPPLKNGTSVLLLTRGDGEPSQWSFAQVSAENKTNLPLSLLPQENVCVILAIEQPPDWAHLYAAPERDGGQSRDGFLVRLATADGTEVPGPRLGFSRLFLSEDGALFTIYAGVVRAAMMDALQATDSLSPSRSLRARVEHRAWAWNCESGPTPQMLGHR